MPARSQNGAPRAWPRSRCRATWCSSSTVRTLDSASSSERALWAASSTAFTIIKWGGLQVEQLTAELSAERSNLQKAENARMALERSNKEMKAKLSEMEAQMRTRSKATIAALESKISNLEEQLDMEARERQALARANRKMDKKTREMLLQVEEERRHADQYKEQVRASAAMARSAAKSGL